METFKLSKAEGAPDLPAIINRMDIVSLDDLTVRVISSFSEWQGVRQQWNDLNEDSVYPNVFATWEWQATWWKTFSGHNNLHILLIETPSQLVGIMPTYIRAGRRFSLLRKHELRFVGNGASVCPEYLGLIVRRNYVEDVCVALTGYFCSELTAWAQLSFEEFALDDHGTNRLVELLCERAPFFCLSGEERLYIALPESYDAFLATLSGHNRQKKRNRLRQACLKQNASLKVMEIDQFDEWYSIVQELTVKGRARKGEKSSFENAGYSAFHSELLHRLMPRGHAEVLLLMLEDKPAAFWYVLKFNGKCYAYQSAADASQSGSPGDVALQMAIQHAIKEGCTEFDFLRGDHPYKRSYTSKARSTATVYLYRTVGVRYLLQVGAIMARATKRSVRRLLRSLKLNRAGCD